MTKKTIIRLILSVAVVIVIAIAAVVVLALIHKPKTGTSPGDPIALDKTPSYKACSVLTIDAIKTALGSSATNLSDGTRTGVVGLNGQPAEDCEYTYSVQGLKDTLSVQVYDYSANTKGGNTSSPVENPDTTWSNISFVKYPGTYKPTYYKSGATLDGKGTVYSMRVIDGAKNYLFTITQPKAQGSMVMSDGVALLEKFAIAANYSVAASTTNAPPAPKTN